MVVGGFRWLWVVPSFSDYAVKRLSATCVCFK